MCSNLFFRFVNLGFFLRFFFCVCARSLTKPWFRPSQPGSCAWLSPFLLKVHHRPEPPYVPMATALNTLQADGLVCIPQAGLMQALYRRILSHRIASRDHVGPPFLSFFLSWVSKTQPSHWTKRMANTRARSAT